VPLSAARVLLHPPKRYVLGFDGENDYVEVADDPSLDITQEITVEALAYPSTVPTVDERVVAKAGWGQNYDLYWHKDGYWVFDAKFSDGNVYGLSSRYEDPSLNAINRWHHLIGRVRDGEIALIVDLTEISRTIPESLTLVTNDNPLKIGTYGYFHGDIVLIRIYNQALSPTEIQHNYLNPMNPVTDGLVLWLKMEEGLGTTVHDYSGYGNDGTIYGATWKEITHTPIRTLTPVRVLSNVR